MRGSKIRSGNTWAQYAYRSPDGWATIKNGELLRRAERELDVFVTVDLNLAYQQNIPKFQITVIVLYGSSSRLADLKALVLKLLDTLPNAPQGQVSDIFG